jgi:hypothetical protein
LTDAEKIECIVKRHYRFGDDGPGEDVFIDERVTTREIVIEWRPGSAS